MITGTSILLGLVCFAVFVLYLMLRPFTDAAGREIASALRAGTLESVSISTSLATKSGPRDSHPHTLFFTGKDKSWALVSYDKTLIPDYEGLVTDEELDRWRGTKNDAKAPAELEKLFNRLAYGESGEAVETARFLAHWGWALGLKTSRMRDLVQVWKQDGSG